jgi:hypothetical protein
MKTRPLAQTDMERTIAANFNEHTIKEISKMVGKSLSWTATTARRIGLCKRKPRS